MPINMVFIDVEQIRRTLQGHMPPAAINLICEMSIRQREMENAINKMEGINKKLMKVTVMFAHLHPEIGQTARQVAELQKQFDRQFNDPLGDKILHEEIKEDAT